MGKATSILTLPRELRQKILERSFDKPIDRDIRFRLCQGTLMLAACGPMEHLPLSAPHVSAWATTLNSMHRIISDDPPFMLSKRLKFLEGIFPHWSPKLGLAHSDTVFIQASHSSHCIDCNDLSCSYSSRFDMYNSRLKIKKVLMEDSRGLLDGFKSLFAKELIWQWLRD